MKKIYIAGKITGEVETQKDMNNCYQKFNRYGFILCGFDDGKMLPIVHKGFDFIGNKKILFTHGLKINEDLIRSGKGTYNQYLKNDIKVLLDCDEAHFLPDWIDSKGAKIEHQLCLDLGIPVIYI